MDEVWQEQQDRENESGADLAECYEWHEKNRMLLDGFDAVRKQIGERNEQVRNFECSKTPF